MSAAGTIADLVGAMHVIVAAVDSEAAQTRRIFRSANVSDPLRRVMIGELMLSVWTEPPKRRERPSGRIAHRCRPLTELEAVGWRLLPVPAPHEASALLGPRMGWAEGEWVAIPPEAAGLPARRFKGVGHAQAWATECENASSAQRERQPAAACGLTRGPRHGPEVTHQSPPEGGYLRGVEAVGG